MPQTYPRIQGIDFDAPGRQLGTFLVDHSDNEYAGAVIPAPIAVLSGKIGPTVLLTAGTHGDEYEGQILLHELIREIDPTQLTGRLIILPALNLLAVRSGTRVSLVDRLNLNRAMPGSATGGPAAQTASILSEHLLPLADFAIDLHSGGSKSNYLPSTFIYRGPTDVAWAAKVTAVEAMDLPWAIAVRAGLKSGSISGAADAAGVRMISTELGGGATVSPQILARARTGLRRLLAEVGALAEDEPTPLRGDTQWLELTDDSPVHSSVAGLFEPVLELGNRVEAGDLIGRVHLIEELDRRPVEFFARIPGVIAVMRHPTLVSAGSMLVNVATVMPTPQ